MLNSRTKYFNFFVLILSNIPCSFLKSFSLFLKFFVIFFLFVSPQKNLYSHTMSFCYTNAGSGSVTFWYGTYHSSNFTEGSFRIQGINGNSYPSTTVSFEGVYSTSVGEVPPGCNVGSVTSGIPDSITTNVFGISNSGVFVEYGTGRNTNTAIRWQYVTFDGLSAGDYQFLYIPISNPTQDWEPFNGIGDFSTNLDSSVTGSSTTLSSSFPADDASNVNLTITSVELTFNETITAGSGNIYIKKSSDNSTHATININGSNISGLGTSTIRASWNTALTHSTGYYVLIDSTAIDGSSGSDFEGITDASTLNFTTMGLPYLTSSSITDNQTGISYGTRSMTFTFNEAVFQGTGLFKIYKSDGTLAFSIDVSDNLSTSGWGSESIVFNWNDYLDLGTSYYVNIENTAIQNSGNVKYEGISDTSTLNFSTSQDGAVLLNSSDPSDNETNVPVNTNKITLYFSENVKAGQGKIYIKDSVDGSPFKAFDVSSSNIEGFNTSTIEISWQDWFSPLQNYHVLIDSTAIKTIDDGPFSGIIDPLTLNFTTASDIENPFNDEDVSGLMEAQVELANRKLEENIKPIIERIELVRKKRQRPLISIEKIKIEIDSIQIQDIINNYINPSLNLKVSPEINNEIIKLESHFLENLEEDFVDLIDLPELILDPFYRTVTDEWAFWSSAQFSFGLNESSNFSSKKEFQSGGISIGADKFINNKTLFGIAFKIGHDNTKIGSLGSQMKSDDFGISMYWSKNLEKFFIDFIVGYTRLGMNSMRNHAAGKIKGRRIAHQLFESITLNREYDFNNFSITPFNRLDVGYTNLRPFVEGGSNAALSFDEQDLYTIKNHLGIKFDYLITKRKSKIHPYANISYVFDFSKVSQAKASYLFDLATVYKKELAYINANEIKFGLGIDYDFYNGWFGASYERTEEYEGHDHHIPDRKYDFFNLKTHIRF